MTGVPVYSRIGIGYDSHRLVEGRRLVIGGVDIPFEKGLWAIQTVMSSVMLSSILLSVRSARVI